MQSELKSIELARGFNKMKTIHKYEVPVAKETTEIKMPLHAVIRNVEFITSSHAVFIWAEVEAGAEFKEGNEVRAFRTFGTGDGVPEGSIYVGSTVDQYVPEAYHVYEVTDCEDCRL